MNDFDSFSDDLLEQSKHFLELAQVATEGSVTAAYLHASLLLCVSGLEAFVNGISDDFSSSDNFSIIEKAFLLEKEIELKNGIFQITRRLKMTRLTERIELLWKKFDNRRTLRTKNGGVIFLSVYLYEMT